MTAPRAAFGDLFCPPSFVKILSCLQLSLPFATKPPARFLSSVSLVFPFEHKGIGCTARWELAGAGARLLSSKKMEQYFSSFLEALCSLKRWQRFGDPDWLLMMEKTSHKSSHEDRGRHKELGVRWEQRKTLTGEVSLVFPQNVVP